MSARLTQEQVDVANSPPRAARLTQGQVDVVNSTFGAVRLTQGQADVANSPPRTARLTQGQVDVANSTFGAARLTQLQVDVLVLVNNFFHTAEGSLVLGGVAHIVSSVWRYFPFGTLAISGQAVVPFHESSGRLTLSGAALQKATTFLASGLLRLSGLAFYRTGARIEPNGALLLSGLAGVAGSVVTGSVGALVLSGLVLSTTNYVYGGSGRLVFSGQASAAITNYHHYGEGMLRLTSGVLKDVISSGWTYYAGHGLLVTGMAMVTWCEAGGLLLFTGEATVTVDTGIRPVGGLLLTGQVRAQVSGGFLPVGRLFRIMGISPMDGEPVTPPPAVIPVPLKAPQFIPLPRKERPKTFAYDERAAGRRFFDHRNGAYVPEVTARLLEKVRQQDVAPGQNLAGKVVTDPNKQ